MNKIIMIVDNSRSSREAVESALQSAGYRVLQAQDGAEGLELLKDKKTEEIGMIIADIKLPKMSGIEFVKEIKKTPFRQIPILVLTADERESKKREGQSAGVSGWLLKPFAPDQLLDVVSRFLS